MKVKQGRRHMKVAFFIFLKCSEFTCGTISGTSGSILKKLELSITVQLRAATGANFSEIFPPAEKKHISVLEKSKSFKFFTSIFFPLKSNFDPELFSEATKYRSFIGRFFLSKTSRIFLPTLPVAPTIAIFLTVHFIVILDER